ncbi:MAG: saccharopine dehydrogenase NADP-binding domain-containing protein [Lysobacterales bacterium]
MQWMIYGANGYSGELTAREAQRRGLKPLLAGRNAAALQRLAESLGLEHRAFALDDAATLRHALRDVELVLNCAGPFSATNAPMLEACLAQRAHYLDITGEIDVFAHAHAQDARAIRAGVVVCPGCGFDVVPTDCLAAQLKARLPSADHLVLAFEAGGGPSPGTALTSVEGLGNGGRARIDGVLTRVPLAWKQRVFKRPDAQGQLQSRTAMTIPWGDVFTAYLSTGIPNVEVYMALSPTTIARARRLRWLRPLLGTASVQAWLKRRVHRSVRGPTPATRDATDTHVWGEASDPLGNRIALRLRTPNGYALTATSAVGIVQHFLSGGAFAPGYRTPSQLMGAKYVMTLPGVERFP